MLDKRGPLYIIPIPSQPACKFPLLPVKKFECPVIVVAMLRDPFWQSSLPPAPQPAPYSSPSPLKPPYSNTNISPSTPLLCQNDEIQAAEKNN